MNLPNSISLARLFAVPVAVWLILNGFMLAAFWVFVAAGISDAVDGFIAKQFHMQTELGEYLDPLADKALLVGVYVALGHLDYLPMWLVILVVFRDIVIVGGAILFETMTRSLTMEPLKISKINTAAQIVLAALVLGGVGFEQPIERVTLVLIDVVAVTTLLSGAAYVMKWSRMASAFESDVPPPTQTDARSRDDNEGENT